MMFPHHFPHHVYHYHYYMCRGSLKTLGWLLLRQDSLYFYDRNPDHGETRKPLLSFNFTSSANIYHILSTITFKNELFHYTKNQLACAFGLRKYSNNDLEEQEVVFLAPSRQCKIEWLEAIGNVLSALSKEREHLVYGDAVEGTEGRVSVTRKRSLKAVSIVPCVKKTSHKKESSESTSELDLSIRSSMLNDSESSKESYV